MLEIVDRFIEGLKKAHAVAQQIHDAELQNVVADLIRNAAALKMEIADLGAANVTLREELAAIRNKQDLRTKLELRNGLYYLTESVKGYSEGPFCIRCFDCTSQLVTLLGPGWQHGKRGDAGTFEAQDGSGWTCPECRRDLH